MAEPDRNILDLIIFISLYLFWIGCAFYHTWGYLSKKVKEHPLALLVKNIFTWIGLTGASSYLLFFTFLALRKVI